MIGGTKVLKPHEYLEKQLEELDITNADLARLIGVAPSSVQRWAKGKIKPPQVLTRLLEVMIVLKRNSVAAEAACSVSWSDPTEVLQDKLDDLDTRT